MFDVVVELALPRTDAGVLAQALVVFPVLLAALVLVWRRHEWRTLVVGVAVLTAGLFGLRMLH